jgi:translation initiation factor IF-3
MEKNTQLQYRVRINQYIRVPQIRVVLADGTNAGIMNTYDALKQAKDQALDLVEINPKAVPPVCKIMDYGKFKYEEKKKQNAAKKNQQIQELKELTFRPNTDENDLSHKVEQAKSFLQEGDRVKFTIRFRGREITHTNIGKDKLDWILKELDGMIQPNPPMSLEGKFLSMIVAPVKKQ